MAESTYLSWADIDTAIYDLSNRLGQIIEQLPVKQRPKSIAPVCGDDTKSVVLAALLSDRLKLSYGASAFTIWLIADNTGLDRATAKKLESLSALADYKDGITVGAYWTTNDDPGMALVFCHASGERIIFPWQKP